jgi:hypothetical protein
MAVDQVSMPEGPGPGLDAETANERGEALASG